MLVERTVDPRVGPVTITQVALAPDLADAQYHLGATLWWTKEIEAARKLAERMMRDPQRIEIAAAKVDQSNIEERLHFTQEEAARYLTIGAIMEFPVPQREAPLTAIFIETAGSANLRGVVLGAQIMPLSQAYDLHLRLVAVYAAFAGGRGPAMLAALVSVAAFDFFFVPPRFSFAVTDVQYLVTFGVMLGGVFSDWLIRRTGSPSIGRKLPIIAGLLLTSTMISANFLDSNAAVIAVMSVAFFGQGMSNLGWTLISEVAPSRLVTRT